MNNLQEDVANWILNWVSVSNRTLGKTPCPFARNALINNRIDWYLANTVDNIKEKIDSLIKSGLDKDKEVVVVGIDPHVISAEDFVSLNKQLNDQLIPQGLVSLEDHPNDPEYINGEQMNQGTWALLLIQELKELNKASEILKRQGYYDNWTQEQLDDVVNWRFDET